MIDILIEHIEILPKDSGFREILELLKTKLERGLRPVTSPPPFFKEIDYEKI